MSTVTLPRSVSFGFTKSTFYQKSSFVNIQNLMALVGVLGVPPLPVPPPPPAPAPPRYDGEGQGDALELGAGKSRKRALDGGPVTVRARAR